MGLSSATTSSSMSSPKRQLNAANLQKNLAALNDKGLASSNRRQSTPAISGIPGDDESSLEDDDHILFDDNEYHATKTPAAIGTTVQAVVTGSIDGKAVAPADRVEDRIAPAVKAAPFVTPYPGIGNAVKARDMSDESPELQHNEPKRLLSRFEEDNEQANIPKPMEYVSLAQHDQKMAVTEIEMAGRFSFRWGFSGLFLFLLVLMIFCFKCPPGYIPEALAGPGHALSGQMENPIFDALLSNADEARVAAKEAVVAGYEWLSMGIAALFVGAFGARGF